MRKGPFSRHMVYKKLCVEKARLSVLCFKSDPSKTSDKPLAMGSRAETRKSQSSERGDRVLLKGRSDVRVKFSIPQSQKENHKRATGTLTFFPSITISI